MKPASVENDPHFPTPALRADPPHKGEGARINAVYGFPPPALAMVPATALQLSPLVPGAGALEDLADACLARIVIAAPPGTLERRFVLAHSLRVLAASGELVAMAPKDKGGARLRGELEAFGCAVVETARRHQRLCLTRAPSQPSGLAGAITAGGPQIAPGLGLWSQPGVFSWDRIDPGSALLLDHLAGLAGRGADLGCGVGVLARGALASPDVREISLIDTDERAIRASRRNIADPRARFIHADVRNIAAMPTELDFVVVNPPFHQGGGADPAFGRNFIEAAAGLLRRGGVCRLVANIALPYEAPLAARFSKVTRLATVGAYKLFEAVR